MFWNVNCVKCDWCCHWLAVSLTQTTSDLRCHWHRSQVVSGVIVTSHQYSLVSLKPPFGGQRCHWHLSPVVSGVNDTSHQYSAVSLKPPFGGQQKGCGSGSWFDPDSETLWIQIRIPIGNPDPDPGARKLRNFRGKNELFSYFVKKFYN
jgi:hypothetical protein